MKFKKTMLTLHQIPVAPRSGSRRRRLGKTGEAAAARHASRLIRSHVSGPPGPRPVRLRS